MRCERRTAVPPPWCLDQMDSPTALALHGKGPEDVQRRPVPHPLCNRTPHLPATRFWTRYALIFGTTVKFDWRRVRARFIACFFLRSLWQMWKYERELEGQRRTDRQLVMRSQDRLPWTRSRFPRGVFQLYRCLVVSRRPRTVCTATSRRLVTCSVRTPSSQRRTSNNQCVPLIKLGN